MVGSKRVTWKIVTGAIIVLIMGNNLPLYLNGSTQANTGLALTVLAIVGGLYLIYSGLYPSTK